jgi:hypothetical protein
MVALPNFIDGFNTLSGRNTGRQDIDRLKRLAAMGDKDAERELARRQRRQGAITRGLKRMVDTMRDTYESHYKREYQDEGEDPRLVSVGTVRRPLTKRLPIYQPVVTISLGYADDPELGMVPLVKMFRSRSGEFIERLEFSNMDDYHIVRHLLPKHTLTKKPGYQTRIATLAAPLVETRRPMNESRIALERVVKNALLGDVAALDEVMRYARRGAMTWSQAFRIVYKGARKVDDAGRRKELSNKALRGLDALWGSGWRDVGIHIDKVKRKLIQKVQDVGSSTMTPTRVHVSRTPVGLGVWVMRVEMDRVLGYVGIGPNESPESVLSVQIMVVRDKTFGSDMMKVLERAGLNADDARQRVMQMMREPEVRMQFEWSDLERKADLFDKIAQALS